MILVFGGSSYIGSKICSYFSNKEKLLAGTFYRKEMRGMVYFDIESPELSSLDVDLRKASHAVICAAVTNIDLCKREEEKSYKLNVKGTRSLIEQLFERKIFPIFFSSDYVYNGKKGNYKEEDKTIPCTVYGKHKKNIEDFLLNSRENFLISRISKNFGLDKDDGTILTSWKRGLEMGERVRCADDQVFSFTYVHDLVRAIDTAIDNNLVGLYNVASGESFSRYALAKKLKSQLNISRGEVVPCSIKEFNFDDLRPLNTSLNTEKFSRDAGFKFTKMESCIEKLR